MGKKKVKKGGKCGCVGSGVITSNLSGGYSVLVDVEEVSNEVRTVLDGQYNVHIDHPDGLFMLCVDANGVHLFKGHDDKPWEKLA